MQSGATCSAPLGAIVADGGVHFAVFSEHAEAVEVCLFDRPSGCSERSRTALRRGADHVWRGYVPGLRPGQLYGYRADGPYRPEAGHRFNARKLLIDPYARAIAGTIHWDDAAYGFVYGGPREDLGRDERDSAPFVPKGVVAASGFDWGDDLAPKTPWERTVIYECHVRGMTRRHPDVPGPIRGRYLGLAAPAVLDHWVKLGVTAVELMPIQHSLSRRRLVERGLSNYWGYDPIALFAPDARFASHDRGGQIDEFKAMVRALHGAGLEVIIDVVFNHTVEGDRIGPTLSMRGLDNAIYYRIDPRDGREYVNDTGCGHTLNAAHPAVAGLVLDCLRYWVTEMHVDGFRFDLATVLGRDGSGFRPDAPLLTAIEEDPVLARVKLIAEPWDVGPGGHRLGRFPGRWPEWNDRYRDEVRRFWRGDAGQCPALAYRLSGSADQFASKALGPLSSVNFVACHDGFTLHDWAAYEQRHNEVNGEDNRDGHGENFSRNWGHEGPTRDAGINQTRQCVARSVLATLALSLGVPMIAAGDEMGRTQIGNNNAYCHDDALSWVNWELDKEQKGLLGFTRSVFGIRRAHRAFGRRRFWEGAVQCACGLKDATWLKADGTQVADGDWADGGRRTLGLLIHEHSASPHSASAVRGGEAREAQETLLLVANAADRDVAFRLPDSLVIGRWEVLVDACRSAAEFDDVREFEVIVAPHSLQLLRLRST